MCGFFAFSTGLSPRELADLFELDMLPRSMQDIESLKFFPKSRIPTISKNSPNKLVLRYWSLIPRWWNKELTALRYATFNARSEDIATKATYKIPWQENQRCLVPATWFYEFKAEKHDTKTVKLPFRVAETNQEIMTLAGLYETWQDPHGVSIESVTILTTAAVEPLANVHSRQPVIIEPADREKWLEKETSADEVAALLRATPLLELAQLDHRFNTAFGEEVTLSMVKASPKK